MRLEVRGACGDGRKSSNRHLVTGALPDVVTSLCHDIHNAGGRAWLVGGWVRDQLLTGTERSLSVDYDLEVYHLSITALQPLLAARGRVKRVGSCFSVLKLCCDQVEIDVALPRREQSSGDGHRDFSVVADPYMEPFEATCRRDFTMNAMMYDPLEGTLLDLHGGQRDIAQARLRHIGAGFGDDPLRPLRAVQFCARFNLLLADETAEVCRSMVPLAQALPVERVWQEWRKWALSRHPDAGLRALEVGGWLSCYPPLARLVGTPQDPRWHPEGDVWQHTVQVCAQAAAIATRDALSTRQRLVLLFAALCHDLGKPDTTRVDSAGVLRSRGHAVQGVESAHTLLSAVGAPGWLSAEVEPLVREHLVHLHGEPTPRAIRRLADRLQPSSIVMWERLIEADSSGRHPLPPSRAALGWLQLAQSLMVTERAPEAVVSGRWLLERGVREGVEVGVIVRAAWQAQLNGQITSSSDAELWWQEYLRANG
ncbi:MAG: HDIG domain-containing protein [Mariprofundales bacterium]|nr:HDIG domain-containing protein [Mariprofundales bacterium]